MCVLSRLLCGSLNVKDFDWADPPSTPTTLLKPHAHHRGGTAARASPTSDSATTTSTSSPSSSSSSPHFRRLRGLAVLRSSAWTTCPTTLSLFEECNNIHVRACVRATHSSHPMCMHARTPVYIHQCT